MGDEDVGAFGYKIEKKVWIRGIEIEWFEAPLKKYSIFVDGRYVCEVSKTDDMCYHPTRDIMYERRTKESISISPVMAYHSVSIVPHEYMTEVKREYCYDRHCRSRDIKLDLYDRKTVVRKKGVEYEKSLDVVLWVGRQPDLCWTSAVDDRDLGITHCIRGIDIAPFADCLEKEASELVKSYKRPFHIFHSMVVDQRNVKFSKFVSSPAIIHRVKEKEEIFGGLAFMSGLIGERKKISLSELVKEANFSKFNTDTNINIVWE